ncbi:MAG: extracellular solute-binding protein [Clostridia bacterium]|nr:extracellular solute-binding protein [Clostridia bacterium]
MLKRIATFTMAVLLIVGLSLAVGAEKRAAVKLFTGKVETVEWMDDLIKRFNKENPGIVVEQEYQKDASNVIKVKLASGDVPDITTVWDQGFADMGKYLDLSNEARWWSRIQPAIRDMCTDLRSGKQYRIATNMTMAGLFYNKAIFAELGLKEATTWEEFKANLKTIKQKRPGVAPLFMGGKESWMLGHLIEFMAHGVIKQQYGAMGSRQAFLANDDSKLRFDAVGGPMDIFASRILELKNEGLLNSDFLTATYDNQLEAFATGKAAMISQGMWALSGVLDKNPDMKEIGFSPYPPIVNGAKPVVLAAEDSAYLIMAESKHKDEAKKFLDYLFRPENLKSYSEFLKAPSSFTDVQADWGPIKDSVAQALKNGINIGFTTEGPSGFSGDDAGRMVQELYMGKYRTSIEFAKAYKAAWDKAWKAANK